MTKLNDPLVTGGGVVLWTSSYRISADSSRVVYIADQDTNNVYELYSAPLEGGTVTKLNDPLDSEGDVYSFDISPDSSRAVYRANQDSWRVDELYSVPLGSGKNLYLPFILKNRP